MVLEVKLIDLTWIHRGSDGDITGAAQHPIEQKYIDFLIVDNQDFPLKNIRCTYHVNCNALFARIWLFSCKFHC